MGLFRRLFGPSKKQETTPQQLFGNEKQTETTPPLASRVESEPKGKPPEKVVNRVDEIKWADWHAYEGPMKVVKNVKVSGVTHINKDGVSRQEILALMKRWETIDLIREPNNPHDEFAIALYGGMGQIGYIAEGTPGLGTLMDRGCKTLAKLSHLYGGEDGKNWGCMIELHLLFPENTYVLDAKIVGMTGKNEDGDNRKEIAEYLEIEEPVMFECTEDKNDNPIITVSRGGEEFGRLSKADCRRVTPFLEKATTIVAEVADVGEEVRVSAFIVT